MKLLQTFHLEMLLSVAWVWNGNPRVCDGQGVWLERAWWG